MSLETNKQKEENNIDEKEDIPHIDITKQELKDKNVQTFIEVNAQDLR